MMNPFDTGAITIHITGPSTKDVNIYYGKNERLGLIQRLILLKGHKRLPKITLELIGLNIEIKDPPPIKDNHILLVIENGVRFYEPREITKIHLFKGKIKVLDIHDIYFETGIGKKEHNLVVYYEKIVESSAIILKHIPWAKIQIIKDKNVK